MAASIDTKIIFEVYESRAAKGVVQDTDRNLNSFESLVGLKYDTSQSLALHVRGSRQIDASLGGPAWRAYVGLNWALGPVCKTEVPILVASTVAPLEPKEAEAKTQSEVFEIESFELSAEMTFKTGSDELSTDVMKVLEAFGRDLQRTGFERVAVEGHTDSIGPDDVNAILSQRRANRVLDYLVEKHKVPSGKIEAVGYGSTRPIADNGNYQGRRKNRRVEIKIWRKKGP